MALRCEMISQPYSYPLRKYSQLRNTPLAHECHFAAPHSHFAAAKWAAKWFAKMPLGCKDGFWLRNHFWATKMLLSYENGLWLWNGCKITSKLRNHLQDSKLTCEMEGGLRKHLAKPREVTKMPTEPCDHAFEEESPAHPRITHTKSLTPFLTSLNHQSP